MLFVSKATYGKEFKYRKKDNYFEVFSPQVKNVHDPSLNYTSVNGFLKQLKGQNIKMTHKNEKYNVVWAH